MIVVQDLRVIGVTIGRPDREEDAAEPAPESQKDDGAIKDIAREAEWQCGEQLVKSKSQVTTKDKSTERTCDGVYYDAENGHDAVPSIAVQYSRGVWIRQIVGESEKRVGHEAGERGEGAAEPS